MTCVFRLGHVASASSVVSESCLKARRETGVMVSICTSLRLRSLSDLSRDDVDATDLFLDRNRNFR